MQKQDDMIAEKTVKEEYQESQENQPEQNYEKIMPPTKPEWYIRDILSTIDRLRGVLSQEDLWRDQAVTMCVDRIGRDAERLEQYVLYPTENQTEQTEGYLYGNHKVPCDSAAESLYRTSCPVFKAPCLRSFAECCFCAGSPVLRL